LLKTNYPRVDFEHLKNDILGFRTFYELWRIKSIAHTYEFIKKFKIGRTIFEVKYIYAFFDLYFWAKVANCKPKIRCIRGKDRTIELFQLCIKILPRNSN